MKKKSVLAITLGISLVVGSVAMGAYNMVQANQQPAEIHHTKFGHERPMPDRQHHQEMLSLLQIDEQTFEQEKNSGKSMSEIATMHHVSRQAVVDLLVKHMNQRIENGLANQRFTIEQANEMRSHAMEKAQQMIDKKPMFNKMHDKMHRSQQDGHKRPMQNQQNHQEMLSLLQIDEQTFEQEKHSGKSMVEIAAAHQVSRQAIVDLLVKHMNERIEKGLAEQRITVEQANEMKSHTLEMAEKMVDKKMMRHQMKGQ